MDVRAKVIVIGAGLAGLTAARALRRGDVDVVVLEARERVGGRTFNHSLGPEFGGEVVEVGGQWVGPGQDRILALIHELGLDTYDTHDEGAKLWDQGGRVRRYRGEIPKAGLLRLADMQLALARLDRMSRRVNPTAPWDAPKAAKWDSQTVASWSASHVRTEVGRAFIGLACEAVWAADAADISLLHFLTYARSSDSLTKLISTRGGAQQSRIVGGSQLIAEGLAAEIADAIVLGAPVHQIDHDEVGVSVSSGAQTYIGDRAILAMSPTLAGRIRYRTALPAMRDQLTQWMPNGSVIKCMAVYDTPFWREQGLSGQGISLSGPVKVFFDNTPSSGSPGVLLGFLEGNQARQFAAVTPAARREAVVGCFSRMFGPAASRPQAYVDKVWADEEWTRGCYGALMPPNTWTTAGPALREPVGRLHWAGAEVATRSMGYMDGAVRSGEAAASEVIRALSATKAGA